MPPRDAFLAPQDVVPLDAAEGRVAAESLATYPPGVPNVLPGEVLTAETLEYVRETLAHGGAVVIGGIIGALALATVRQYR